VSRRRANSIAPSRRLTMDGVIRPKWRDLVIEDVSEGSQRVNCINYEICVLQGLRERLRSKEVGLPAPTAIGIPMTICPRTSRSVVPDGSRAFGDKLARNFFEGDGQKIAKLEHPLDVANRSMVCRKMRVVASSRMINSRISKLIGIRLG
jgi:hypothetical protein